MDLKEVIAQSFGIIGMILTVYSFQEKNNKKFFIKQGLAGSMFFLNFILIDAFSAAFFNLTNLIRGSLYSKKTGKKSSLIIVLCLYTACFAFSVFLVKNAPMQIFLSALVFSTLILMSVLMWQGNGKNIRYGQFFVSSPSWLIHNFINFSLGGILCEVFSMSSVIISFVRYGKNGFEK